MLNSSKLFINTIKLFITNMHFHKKMAIKLNFLFILKKVYLFYFIFKK